ncbi:nucleotidyltransferase domain-containing protein, partial [Streptomyces globisporus]|uniref:DNA polymerase beta superfamily protein n=1 Tax=Streptomyces globisporus TaxID=1908 RepID=UPI0034616ADE
MRADPKSQGRRGPLPRTLAAMISATDEALVRDHTVYACVMGSRAFGLATEDSDIDRRG